MLITVEYNTKGVVEIYMDDEGLNLLIDRLTKLKRHSGKGEHDHLMTSAWSGWELAEQVHGDGNELVHHLCLILKPHP